MRNTWKLIMDWRAICHIYQHEHTTHGNAGAGMDGCIIFSMWVGGVVAFGISALMPVDAGVFITAGVFEQPSVGRSISVGWQRHGGEHD